MADDILVAGLDVSGFSPEKKRLLDEYVITFEKLEKYNGMVFTPLSGDGLTAFNNSAKQTNELLLQINFKLATLNSNISDIGNEGSNSIKKVNASIKETNSSIEEMGIKLTKAYGWLRRIAYILPGIGIAGIFNAAFTAIGDVATALGLTNTKLIENEDINARINNSLVRQIELYDELYKQREKLRKLTDISGYEISKEKTELESTSGVPKNVLLQKEIDDLKIRFKKASEETVGENGAKELSSSVRDRSKYLNDLADGITELQRLVDAKDERGLNQKIKDLFSQHKVIEGVKQPFSEKENEATVKDLKARYDLAKKTNDEQIELVKEFYDSKFELEKKQRELDKFNSDENRKQRVEEGKESLKSVIAYNEAIVKDENSTELQIIEAEKRILKAKKDTIQLDLYNVTANRTSTDKEKSVAQNKAFKETDIAVIESKSKLLELTERFYQRDIKAQTESSKEKEDSIALANEKIFQNEQNSLEERLSAYSKYVVAKNKIADLEYDLSIDKPGLLPSEKKEAATNRDKQKETNVANSQKQLYDIVYSAGKDQLKVIKDTNELQTENYNKTYVDQLEALNKSFANKEIGYYRYKKNRQILDDKFAVESRQFAINNDLQELKRIREKLKEEEIVKQGFEDQYNNAPDLKSSDDAIAKLDAQKQVISDTKKYENEVQARYNDHSRQLEIAQYNKELEGEKQLAANKEKIREELFALSIKLVDQETQYELDRIALKQQAIDEAYQSEIDAIDKSSLSSKDKTALDIQLIEQKKEADKKAQLEERKLKRESAIIDREIAIAKTIWDTEKAVAESLPNIPLSVTAGILGAIALATILATPIPSFAEGVIGFEGGIARYGEAGTELIKKPGKKPYLVHDETVSYLPKGTDIIPMNDSPVFDNRSEDSSWQQTEYLANVIKKGNKQIKNVFKPTIIFNDKFENHKRQILGN